MADFMSHEELVTRICLNSRLTAPEVEEALEVLAAVIQENLQKGTSVDLLGVGRFSATDGEASFTVSESLTEIIRDQSLPVQIQRPASPPRGTVPDIGTYKHKVNVCATP
jgi:nucleoid DNA-binding protein